MLHSLALAAALTADPQPLARAVERAAAIPPLEQPFAPCWCDPCLGIVPAAAVILDRPAARPKPAVPEPVAWGLLSLSIGGALVTLAWGIGRYREMTRALEQGPPLVFRPHGAARQSVTEEVSR